MAARQTIESSTGRDATGWRIPRVPSHGQSNPAIALIEALDEDACALLAERLGPYLRLGSSPPDEWLDASAAADYLSLPRSTLHKLTAERAIPFAQDGPGCKLYFKRSALDAWREG